MKRASVAVAATVGLFVLVQAGALALVEPFMDAGYRAVEDPSDPTNSLLYVGAILVATAVMLASIRAGVDRLLQGLVVFAATFIAFYVFSVVLPPVLAVGGLNVLAVGAAIVLGAGLLVHPEWYVIDAAGVVMGAGAAGIFGISFGLAPALVLLVALAVYDAVSVYGTEHMLTLASGAMDLRLPVVFVVPLTPSYSFLEADDPAALSEDRGDAADADDAAADAANGVGSAAGASDAAGAAPDGTGHDHGATTAEESTDPLDRDAFFVGLGDAVIPTVLVASAAFFRPGGAALLGVPGLAVTAPALGAMAGTLCGLLALLWLVLEGRAHAGLPLLNGGAIAGYLAGTVAVGVPVVDALGLAPYV